MCNMDAFFEVLSVQSQKEQEQDGAIYIGNVRGVSIKNCMIKMQGFMAFVLMAIGI